MTYVMLSWSSASAADENKDNVSVLVCASAEIRIWYLRNIDPTSFMDTNVTENEFNCLCVILLSKVDVCSVLNT